MSYQSLTSLLLFINRPPENDRRQIRRRKTLFDLDRLTTHVLKPTFENESPGMLEVVALYCNTNYAGRVNVR